MESLLIQNNVSQSRFQATLGGHLAMLNYQIRHDIFQIDYVYVPAEFRGRGIASTLMQTALAYARDHGLRPVPICGFAREYMERHTG